MLQRGEDTREGGDADVKVTAKAKSSKQIGALLQVSEATIVKHRQNIMEKLNLRSVAELTKYAIQQGITSIEL